VFGKTVLKEQMEMRGHLAKFRRPCTDEWQRNSTGDVAVDKTEKSRSMWVQQNGEKRRQKEQVLKEN
jgi:hypothetical protein